MLTVLTFLDLVIARVLYENRESPPSQRRLLVPGGSAGLINAYLQEHNIPLSFTIRLTSNERLTKAITRLRACHLIEPSGTYVPTLEMEDLWDKVGSDWTTWPHKLPCDANGEPQYQEAEHRRQVRNYRKRKELNE